MRVFFAGATVSSLSVSAYITLTLLAPSRFALTLALLHTLYAVAPLALAYAVLRHRVFDLGVILRQGLQYALARRVLVSAVPLL
jgi:hypothetical protein